MGSEKWIWCLLAAVWGPTWSPVGSVTVKTPPKIPGTVEAQAKFFQDFFSVQLSPYKIEFGHVCEDPNTWEQRYEKKDFKNHRDMGKVRWGDKQGGYGEHYWDLNHAGNAHNHGDDDFGNHDEDDGSYHDTPYTGEYKVNDDDPYDEPSEQNPSYNSDYDGEKADRYEETNRAKRAHPKIKEDEPDIVKTLHKRKTKDEQTEQPQKRRKVRRHNAKPKEIQEDLISNQGEDEIEDVPKQQAELTKENEARARPEHYVPYEGGAGVRTHQQTPITPAATVPRLFLEPTTGHVVDRATGQAYLLQPIVANFN